MLIADDDDMIQPLAPRSDRTIRWHRVVGSAKDAAEAIQIASMRSPDVALLDVRMPAEVAPTPRERSDGDTDARIVALSGRGTRRSVDTMLATERRATWSRMLISTTSWTRSPGRWTEAPCSPTEWSGTWSPSWGAGSHVSTRWKRNDPAKRNGSNASSTDAGASGWRISRSSSSRPERSSGSRLWPDSRAGGSGHTDVWFKEAAEIGMGTGLQVAAVEIALAALDVLPPDVFVSVNVDPTAATSQELAHVLQRYPGERLVIELTEHAPASDYASLRTALDAFRRSGIRIAVDDAGAGFASLRHILELAPDIIKLDISIVRDIDTEAAHRALASALVGFAREIGTALVAEGVETVAEASTLRSLGVPLIQGYFAARPGPIPDRFVIPLPSALRD